MEGGVSISFLGDVAVEGPNGRVTVRGAQPAVVLARLVLDRPAPLPREALLETLWGEDLPDHWAGAARKVVSRARRALADAGLDEGALRSLDGVLTLGVDGPLRVDVEEVLEAVTAAEAALAAGDAAAACEGASGALVALDRPFLPGTDGPWCERQRSSLQGARQRCLHALADAARIAGDLAASADHARRAIELDPFDERAAHQLMEVLVHQGSTAGALAVYERLRRALDQQLGVRPGLEVERAYLQLLGEEPAMAPPRVAAPAPRRPAGVDLGPFVGRASELAQLHAEWEESPAGVRVVVVWGEPGVGKTRLVAELADAVDDGSTVLWARCDRDVNVAHGPFADLVRQLVDGHPDLLGRLGSTAARLVALVPELAPAADLEAPGTNVQRARLARAVTTALTAVGDRPLLLVLDDLHWADGDTMALLAHVVARLAAVPVLVVVTLREASGQVAATLAELATTAPTTTIALKGLDDDALGALLHASDVELPDDVDAVARVIHDRTGGNALYVTQLVREAEASDSPLDPGAVPVAVTQLLERRLAALDHDPASVLRLAAVIGAEFDLATIEACSALDEEQMLDVVEELSREALLVERGEGRFGFAHNLVRDAVLATLGRTRRQQLHQRVATVLAAEDADPGVLAHHLLSSGPIATGDAVVASLDAGRAALDRSAWAAAAEHFGNAAARATDDERRAEALTGLGSAQRGLGEPRAARRSLEEALELGRRVPRPRLVAAAILALVGGGGRGVALDLPDQERSSLLREALAGLGPDDPDLAVPVLSELALSLVLADAEAERAELCERCLAEARRWGDPAGLLTALQARRIVLMGPDGTEARLAGGQEAVALVHSALPDEASIAAHLGLVEDLLELGHRAAASVELAHADRLATQLDHPYWLWSATSWRALSAIVDGDLDRAEDLAAAALARQAQGDHPEAVAAFAANLVNIRLFQGRAAEVLDGLRAAADENPQIPAYRAVLALCLAETGGHDEAAEVFAGFAEKDFDLPADSNCLLAVAALADACATLGRGDHAALLAGLLEPWADRHVVLNCYGGGGAYWGPVAHHLGRLAALRGQPAEAEGWLRRSLDRCRRFGAPRFAERSAAALTRLGAGAHP